MKIEQLRRVIATVEACGIEEIGLVAQRDDGEAIHFNEMSVYYGCGETLIILEDEKEDIGYAKENN